MIAAGDARRVPFPQEQKDRARFLFGRLQYRGGTAAALAKEFEITPDRAADLITLVQEETVKELTQTVGDNPLATQFLFLQSVVSDEGQMMKNRLAASHAIIKLLGMEKLFSKMGSDDVNTFLATLAKSQAMGSLLPVKVGAS